MSPPFILYSPPTVNPRVYHVHALPPSYLPPPLYLLSTEPPTTPLLCTVNISHIPADIPAIRTLFSAYSTALGIDLSFQSFATELASLPGSYSEPGGCLLVARRSAPPDRSSRKRSHDDATADDEPLGCVALRPLPQASPAQPSSPDSAPTAEIKRLYTIPATRGSGLGRVLCAAVVAEARARGYGAVVLDTLPSMGAARAIYRDMGFKSTGRYYETPLEGTEFLRKELK